MGSDSTGLSGNSSQSANSTESVSHVVQPSVVSHATVALYEQSRDNLIQAQTQLVNDIVRSAASNPNETMTLIQRAKHLQEQANQFTQDIGSQVTGDFTPQDVNVMRDMKDQKVTEANIAKYFHTNQTKVNRLLNNK